MAKYIDSFDKAAAHEKGDKDSRTQKYYLSCVDEDGDGWTGEEIYDWLGDPLAEWKDPAVPYGSTPVPKTYDDRPLANLEYKHLRDIQPEWYEIIATYATPGTSGGGGGGSDNEDNIVSSASWNFGTAEETVQLSRNTDEVWPTQTGDRVKGWDHNKLVNVRLDEDGKKYVDGYQRRAATLQFSYSIQLPGGTFSNGSRNALASYVTKINSESFMGFAARTVMFLGASVTVSVTNEVLPTHPLAVDLDVENSGKMVIELQFEHKRSGSRSIPILQRDGNVVNTNVSWDGQQLLWAFSRERFNNDERESIVVAAYAEDIYEEADLNDLFQVGTNSPVWGA